MTTINKIIKERNGVNDRVSSFKHGDNLAWRERPSFNGFSGTSEYESYPLRNMFLMQTGKFASEWSSKAIDEIKINQFIKQYEKKVLSTYYLSDNKIIKCLISIGGAESVYAYIFRRGGDYKDGEMVFYINLLFKRKTSIVDKIINYINSISIQENPKERCLNILVKSSYGYNLEEKPINPPDIDFTLNYNSDFEQIHKLIMDKLSIENSKGLVLLHGIAGSGKTTYIRYLINQLNKRVIFIPPSMASVLSEPELIKFLMNHSNSILVIEDAENVLMKRQGQSSQSVSNILNLTDGLLSDCANIQIVATFNTDLKNIDEALLRKGRIIAKYEFTKLEESRSKLLAEKLGLNVNSENTLAEIYNAEDLSFSKEKNKIGFSK